MREEVAEMSTWLQGIPSSCDGAASSFASASPSPEELTGSPLAPSAHQVEEGLNTPGATLLNYLFTPTFFKETWEQAPLVTSGSALPRNPFVGHRWIAEEDMVCMCYRAAVAGTLKIFRQGVAYPPPTIPLPDPPLQQSQEGEPRNGRLPSRDSSETEGKAESACHSGKREAVSVEGEICSETSSLGSRAGPPRGVRGSSPLPDKELSETLKDRASTDASEPETSCLLACVGPYLDGCSLVLNQADRTHQGLQDLCRTLAQRLFTHVFAVAYLTPPSSYAVDIHSDDQDVFLIQLWGQKHWKVYAPPQELPLSEETLGKKEPFRENPGHAILQLTLEEGDILYIPRGFPHEALTTYRNSLHITVTIPTAEYAYINVLNRFLRNLVIEHKLGAATEKYCRAAILPKTTEKNAQRSDAEEKAEKATKELTSFLKYEGVVDVLQDHLEKINAMQIAQFKRLQAIPAKPVITQASLVRLASGIRCTCEEGSAEALFFRRGQSLRMKIYRSASTAIHQLAAAQTFTEVSKLQCSDNFERLCVLLVLHRKGLIEVVDNHVAIASP